MKTVQKVQRYRSLERSSPVRNTLFSVNPLLSIALPIITHRKSQALAASAVIHCPQLE